MKKKISYEKVRSSVIYKVFLLCFALLDKRVEPSCKSFFFVLPFFLRCARVFTLSLSVINDLTRDKRLVWWPPVAQRSTTSPVYFHSRHQRIKSNTPLKR